jgi:hypothetical protein
LFGAKPSEDLSGELSDAMAVAAAQQLLEFVRSWTSEAESLGDRFDNSRPIEGEEMCISMVERRLEVWAALVAIDEAYLSEYSEGEEDRHRLTEAMDSLIEDMQKFDKALLRQRNLLSIAAGTNLLQNWISMLVSEFQEAAPWVLDGTLEKVAAELEADALAMKPERMAEHRCAPVVIRLADLYARPARVAASQHPEQSNQAEGAQPQGPAVTPMAHVGPAPCQVKISLTEKLGARAAQDLPWAEDELEINSIVSPLSAITYAARVGVRATCGQGGILKVTLATGSGIERKEAKLVLTREEPEGEFRGDPLPLDLGGLIAELDVE